MFDASAGDFGSQDIFVISWYSFFVKFSPAVPLKVFEGFILLAI